MNRTINGIDELAELIASLNPSEIQTLAETLFAKNESVAEDLSGTITWSLFDRMVQQNPQLADNPVDNSQ